VIFLVYWDVRFLFLICGMVIMAGAFSQSPLKVMTYNIKYDAANEPDNNWQVRRPWVLEIIRYENPEILGVQEALVHQVNDIAGAIEGYVRVGVGRDDGKDKGEFSALYFNAEVFTEHQHGTFWLSDTPDKVSKGWDAALPRIATFVHLSDQEGNEFVVYNAHLDHRGELSRRKAVELILKHKELNFESIPCIIMGDLNFTDKDVAFQQLLDFPLTDSRNAEKVFGPKATFNGFNWEAIPTQRIDYIFYSDEFTGLRHTVITTSQPNRYPSDHFPVMAEITLK
jgi:endonuclease/exonuclease/phosphatase family metal-dependent hydrolase